MNDNDPEQRDADCGAGICYDAEVYRQISTDEGQVQLVRKLKLPFAPTPGIDLGLHPRSGINSEVTEVASVLWCVDRSLFVIETVDDYRSKKDAVKFLIEESRYKVHFIVFETREAAESAIDEETEHQVIPVDGGWACADPLERWASRLSGQSS